MAGTYFIFSPKRHNAILLTGLIICLSSIKLLSDISNEATIFSLFLLVPTFLLARHFGTAEALITITNDQISAKWTHNFSLKHEQDFSIDFSNIKDWAVDVWGNYSYFRFTDRNNRVIMLSLDRKNGSMNNYEFHHHLRNRIGEFNKIHKSLPIRRGKTFFQRRTAIILAFISGAALILGWASYFTTDNMKLPKLIFATIFIGTHIGLTIVQNRK